jgi:S1-C subfamily serine protease
MNQGAKNNYAMSPKIDIARTVQSLFFAASSQQAYRIGRGRCDEMERANNSLEGPTLHHFPSPIRLVFERRRSCPAVVLLFLILMITRANSDELAEKGKAIFKKNQRAVVTVQLVLKSKFSMAGLGNQSNESRQDVTGTVVDGSGLTVLSLSATDPGQMLQSLMAMGDEESRFKMDTELSDVKILLEDGTELAAEVILRDKDLDLAFIRPKTKPAAPMLALELTNSAKADVLDQVIALNRLGNAAGRAYAASVVRISAIVQRPRLFYVPDGSTGNPTLGAPAFTLDGKLLGIFVMRSIKGKGGGGALGMFGMQTDNLTSIIVPAEDILKGVKQVPTGEKSTEEKKSNP